MNEEEVTQLQEELTHAKAKLEEFECTVADREARALHLEEQLNEAKQELSSAREGIERRDGKLATLQKQASGLEGQIRTSAERYRQIALERSPELPADLIAGETVEEIDASIERARETVSKVRGHLEAHMRSTRVPVGAPARSEPDFADLNAQQKIARGIEQRRSA
jgi:chromosome segregation ATPase